jgi:hypothetical protein
VPGNDLPERRAKEGGTVTLVALPLLAILSALSLVAGRAWVPIILTAYAFSAVRLSGLNDVRSIIPFTQSVGEYGAISGAISGAMEGFRDLTYTIQDQFSRIEPGIWLLIGLGLVVALALWARRPSGA